MDLQGSLPRAIGAGLVAILLGLILSAVYRSGESLGLTGWEAALLCHMGGSMVVLGVFIHPHRWSSFLSLSGDLSQATPWLRQRPWALYAPASLLLLGSLLLVGLSRLVGGSVPDLSRGTTPLLWLTLVPLSEEIFFRVGLGQLFERVMPGLWGAWFASLTFAMAHTNMTWGQLVRGELHLPLGPFLLGLSCQYLYRHGRNLAPIVCLHAVANGTAVIFSWGDGRWLDWLEFLYL